ncbi:MAG: TlpA family protein disulfide reductase [Acidimicrobiales bacterium]
MLITVLIVAVVVAGAAVLSVAMQRRRPDPPTSPRMAVPQQLDRSDFADPDSPWLMVVFGSATCASCRDAWSIVERLDVPSVSVQRLDFPAERAIHERYRIDSVPTIVLADTDGVVRWSSLGVPNERGLAEALEDLDVVPPDDGTAIPFG